MQTLHRFDSIPEEPLSEEEDDTAVTAVKVTQAPL
jgi:hypothetical protein